MLWPLSLKAKLGLGVLVSYSSYALFVSYAANREITRRSNLEKTSREKALAAQSAKNNGCDHAHGVMTYDDLIENKYKSFTIAGRFENPFEEYRALTLFEFFLSRFLELFEGKSRGSVPSTEKLRELLPVFKPDLQLLKESSLIDKVTPSTIFSSATPHVIPRFEDRLTFTWLGQSCAFLQISGVNILTDPLFSDYLVNPYLGPKRITPSPCELQDLPKPHFILVSHNHPDHLDAEAVDQIHNSSTWIVPLGIKKFLAKRGIHNTIELDWWDKVKLNVKEDPGNLYEVACTPAMHWSGRKLWDSNDSLWCSFLILKNGKPIFYHAGDTGYVSDLFTKIGEKYGFGTRLAMLPCGQYCPQWHQKPRHINPEECHKIMNDLKAKKVLGVHFGTFVLSSEHFLEPKLKFEQLAKDLNKTYDFFNPDFGKTLVMDINDDNDDDVSAYIPIRDGQSFLMK